MISNGKTDTGDKEPEKPAADENQKESDAKVDPGHIILLWIAFYQPSREGGGTRINVMRR
jgi:hypothetical protein